MEATRFESDAIDQLAAALATAQGQFPDDLERNRLVTVRHRNGGSHSYTYATLDHLIKHHRKPLAENGLSITQQLLPSPSGNGLMLFTRLLHASGQWIGSVLPIVNSSDPQAQGGDITYKRRYQYAAILGICADEDDDANLATGREATNKPRERAKDRPQGATQQQAERRTAPAPVDHPIAKPYQTKPPALDKVAQRISELESAGALIEWVENARTYEPISKNPTAWKTISRMLVQKLTRGYMTDQSAWDKTTCDKASDLIREVTKEIEANAPPSQQQPEPAGNQEGADSADRPSGGDAEPGGDEQ